ncbi:hypothetical protein FS837_000861 [Tulasnella sp. UAMH 9824]|nr:hypothetical protein FS837_000861 [Tulasnella sp. UAMH 9824]
MEKQPPARTLRKRTKSTIHQITGCTNQQSAEGEVLKLSEVAYQVLERIFLFVAANDLRETNGARLAVVRLVNRYWNDAARRVLYRQITLTRVNQLDRLVKAVDLVPTIRSQIVQLSLPKELITDAMQKQRALGSRLLFGPREEYRPEAEKSVVTTLLELLSKLTSLDSVSIHADYMRPIFTLHDDTLKSPDLGILTAIRHLRIADVPGANWIADFGIDQLRHSRPDCSPAPRQEPARIPRAANNLFRKAY